MGDERVTATNPFDYDAELLIRKNSENPVVGAVL